MRRIYAYIIILVTAMLVTLSSCSDGGRTYKIGVSQCSQGAWRQKVNHEMLAAQHLYEHEAAVTIAYSYDDTDLQIRQIDSLCDSGIDLLVVAPNEAAPIADAIARAKSKGIPVIFFDRKAATDDYTAFIGGNNQEAGRTVADYAVSLAQGIGTEGRRPRVLEVTATMSTSPAQERHQGFESVMRAHPELDYVCINSEWSADSARSVVSQQLSSGHVPDIVFCHSDFMAHGAHEAVEEAGLRTDVRILGIDGMPDEGISYVQQGVEDGTYIYPTHGEKIVRLALDILTGKSYERDNFLPSMMVTPGNADLVAMNSRELLRQGDDIITIHGKLEQSLLHYDVQHKLLLASIIVIVALVVAVIMSLRAWLLARKAIRQRQAVNEEQTLFYTDAGSRRLHDIFDKPDDDLPPPRSQDVLFAEQLNEAIRKHMSNPNLKMDELGDEMKLSRVQLYRRVKALTGQSPVELLRQMRLQRAYALLQSTTKTVNEIAYEVGFNTPGYFSKCFREQYGKYPTDLRAQ